MDTLKDLLPNGPITAFRGKADDVWVVAVPLNADWQPGQVPTTWTEIATVHGRPLTEALVAHLTGQPKPAWNIVDPAETLGLCVGCGQPVQADRYAWREVAANQFEFAHVACAQEIN